MNTSKLFEELQSKGVECNTEDTMIDELMKNAILALRTCLVELQKVSTLSDNFKAKYLATLKRTVCHEALIGTSVDSDDELSDPTPNLDESGSSNVVESALATLQTVGGTLSIPLHITQQSITMIPSATQIERNVEFLKRLGYPGELMAKLAEVKSAENSPDKSEEEKHLLCDLAQ
ncbi:unnamed protein product [Caenorhabditis angaria]|uniref:MEIS N-terminal domain-containing protein n=1 Tax=Caenorhabditis angaria TaxID=860376 RepID=A0A9P1NBC0_9PELO|nr:unnamed protein product [Caenorhabditis angaria]